MPEKDPRFFVPPPEYSERAEGGSHSHTRLGIRLEVPRDSKESPEEPGPPPSYTSPVSYKIGSQRLLEPLVGVSQLKSQLTLLREFHALKRAVKEVVQSIDNFQTLRKDYHLRGDGLGSLEWLLRGMFRLGSLRNLVGSMSVFRFYRWLLVLMSSNGIAQWLELQFPPIGVLMVWHAYLLNPRYVLMFSRIPAAFDCLLSWYVEDCDRLP